MKKLVIYISCAILLTLLTGCVDPATADKALTERMAEELVVKSSAIEIVHLADSSNTRLVVVNREDVYFVMISKQSSHSEYILKHKQKLDLSME